MESCNVTIGNNKIEFHGVRSTYPLIGEQVQCFFTVPTQYRPEVGDFIGIYPVGWSSLVAHCQAKKTVKPENVMFTPAGQQYGKVEFDGEYLMQSKIGQQQQLGNGEQYYQFVYVKNGEYIRGASTPFMFVPTTIEQLTTGLRGCNGVEAEIKSIFGGRQQQQQTPFGLMLEQLEQQQQQPLRQQNTTVLEQVVEREMQKLQNGIFGLEQGLVGYKSVFPLIEETIQQQQQQQWQLPEFTGKQWKQTVTGSIVPSEIMCELVAPMQSHQTKKHWSNKIAEVQQMLGEQIRLEQAQRRIEQLNMQVQLKSYERHIQHVQRREQEICEYLRAKMLKQVAEFEQKVYNVLKLSECQQQQQPEHYVRKYEQLLKEKVELDIQKRIAIYHQLRKTIKECERKIREIQTGEQQHYARFHQSLKTRIGQFETKFYGQYTVTGCGIEKVETELCEQLKQLVGQLINEQRKEQFQLIKAQKQMQYLCQEVQLRLQDFECPEIYATLRIPRIASFATGSTYYPQYEQHYTQVQQLEQQLSELKQTLRQKMFAQQPSQQQQQLFGGLYTPASLITGEWIKPVSQKLRELEWTLRQEKQMQQEQQIEMPVRQWYERRIQTLVQHMKYFEQRQMEQQMQGEQQQPKMFEEYRLRELLSQFRQLEQELCQYPQFYKNFKYQPHHQQQMRQLQQQQQQVVELCQYLQTIVREKIALLATIYEQSPIECFVQTGNHAAWKQMLKFERKLAQLKGLIVERQQYQQLQQRLAELEQWCQVGQINGVQGLPLHRQEKVQEQIRQLRKMVVQHQQQWQQQQWEQQQYLQQQLTAGHHQPQPFVHWSVVPEQFVQHQEKYNRLCQMIGELEAQCQQFNGINAEVRIPMGVYGQQQKQQQFVGLNWIHERFARLVAEFQERILCQQQPRFEQYAEKVESLAHYLRKAEQQLRNKQPFCGQQLREKIQEFEQIVCEQILCGEQQQPEFVQGQNWTVQQQQQQTQVLPTQVREYLRQAGRQVRELKSQIQTVLDGWVLINQVNGNEFECDFNNNNGQQQQPMTPFGGIYEQPEFCPESTTLGELLSLRQQLADEFVPRMSLRQSLLETPFPEGQQQQRRERKMEQIERLFEQEQQKQQFEELFYQSPVEKTTTGLRSLNSVENLIGELETELVKLRLQKEEQQTLYPTTTYTTGVRGFFQTTPETVCEEITKIVGQNLLTTVVPTIVKYNGEKQQQQEQKQTTTVVVAGEPTPFGTQTVKVQQTTQQF